jgi:hypothetical protein
VEGGKPVGIVSIGDLVVERDPHSVLGQICSATAPARTPAKIGPKYGMNSSSPASRPSVTARGIPSSQRPTIASLPTAVIEIS